MSDVDEWIAKYLTYVDRAISMVPYERLKVWKDFFFNPTETVAKDNVGIGQRLKDLYVMTGVSVILGLLAILPIAFLNAIFNPIGGVFLAVVFVVEFVVILFFGPIIGFLYSLLELLVAKILGGTGNMQANFNASALPGLAVMVIMLPISIASIPLSWISAIPLVSLCMLCISLPLSVATGVIWLYSYYLKYLAFKEVHKLSSLRAAGVVVLPMVALIALAVVIFILIYAAIIAWFMSVYTAGATLPG